MSLIEFNHHKETIYSIEITRSSVCMGDDCTAPHASELYYTSDEILSELMDQIADYLPDMTNVVWTIKGNYRDEHQDLAKIFFDENGNYTKQLLSENVPLIRLHLKKVFCFHESFEPGEYKLAEAKKPSDMITDGVLSYGVDVGRLVFRDGKITVYVLGDLEHIGPSDAFMVYQITKLQYKLLLQKSCKNRIPDKPVPISQTDACKERFLCGESAYGRRYQCTLVDVDLSLADVIK